MVRHSGKHLKTCRQVLNTCLLSTGVFVVSAVSAGQAYAETPALPSLPPQVVDGLEPRAEQNQQEGLELASQAQPTSEGLEEVSGVILPENHDTVTSQDQPVFRNSTIQPEPVPEAPATASSQPETSLAEPEVGAPLPASQPPVAKVADEQVLPDHLPASQGAKGLEQDQPVSPEPIMGDLNATNLLNFLQVKDALPVAPQVEGFDVLENHVHIKGQVFYRENEPTYPENTPVASLDLGQNYVLTIINGLGNFVSQWRRIANGDSLYIYQKDAQDRHRLEAIYKVTARISLVAKAVPTPPPAPEPPLPEVTEPAAPVDTPPVAPSDSTVSEPAEPVVVPPVSPSAPTVSEPAEPVVVSPIAPSVPVVSEPVGPVVVLPVAPSVPVASEPLEPVVVSPIAPSDSAVSQPIESPGPAAEGDQVVTPPLVVDLPLLGRPVEGPALASQGRDLLTVLPADFGQQVLGRVQDILQELDRPAPALAPERSKKKNRPVVKQVVARFDQSGKLLLDLPTHADRVTLVFKQADGRQVTHVLTKSGDGWLGLPQGMTYDEGTNQLVVAASLLQVGLQITVQAYLPDKALPQVQTYQLLEAPASPTVSNYEDSLMIRPPEGIDELTVRYIDDRGRSRRVVTRRNSKGKWVSLSNFFVDQSRGTLLIPARHLENGSKLEMESVSGDQVWLHQCQITFDYHQDGKRVTQIDLERGSIVTEGDSFRLLPSSPDDSKS